MFRFTIRDVLWLTVVVAIVCAWWIEWRRERLANQRIEVLESEVEQSRFVAKSLYDDLDRIERALPSYDAQIIWSRDMRPTLQPLPPATTPGALNHP